MSSRRSSTVPDDRADIEFAEKVGLPDAVSDLPDDIDADFEPVTSADVTQPWQEVGVWTNDFLGFTESLEEAEQVLQEYEISTGSKFIVNYVRINFGKSFMGK